MFPNLTNAYECRERSRELQRQAEREHLIRLALSGRQARPGRRVLWMAWMGQRLVTWGERLQARSGHNRAPARVGP
jgi:hypothetical protein